MNSLKLTELDLATLSKNLQQLESEHTTEELELVDLYGDVVGCNGNCKGGCMGKCGHNCGGHCTSILAY